MEANYFTILYWFSHTSTWIHHGCTRVPNPEPLSHLPPHTISLGHPSAPAPSILYPASNLDWRLVSYMILYMFQCHSPKSSHPLPLPQSPKDCSIHLCLFCCLTYRVIIETCILSCKKWIASLCLMQDAGCLGLVHGHDPERWYEVGGGRGVQDWELMYTCGRFMSMYAKTNTVL